MNTKIEDSQIKSVESIKLPKAKNQSRPLSRKIKATMIGFSMVTIYATSIGTLSYVNNFFRHNELKFNPIIEFHYPVTIAPRSNVSMVSPVPEGFGEVKAAEVVATPTLEPKNEKVGMVLKGTASWYSREGCLGCSETLTMANGQPLDDDGYTIALPVDVVKDYRLLNQMVRVQNPKNGQMVIAQVTDTGGFDKYNRIADMTPAVRDALFCGDLCEIEIFFE